MIRPSDACDRTRCYHSFRGQSSTTAKSFQRTPQQERASQVSDKPEEIATLRITGMEADRVRLRIGFVRVVSDRLDGKHGIDLLLSFTTAFRIHVAAHRL